MMVEQNIFCAYGLAVFGGCLQVVAILVLAYPATFREKHHNELYSEAFEQYLVPCNIFIQLTIGLVNTVSTWYGPVAMVMPIRVSAQLFFNMLFFGSLGIEEFPKDVQIGTYIVVSGAFFLPIVGPTVQQGQNAVELLEETSSELWTMVLTGLTVFTGFICVKFFIVQTDVGVVNNRFKFQIILTARICSTVLATSLSKLLVSTTGSGFVVTLFGYTACSIVIATVAFLQATDVDQNLFFPASACGIQVVNAVTGLILWQDWRVIQSWAGYSIVMALIVFGVYHISSLENFSQSADSDYSLAQSISILIAKDIAEHTQEPKAQTSIVAYAGGNLKTMLHDILRVEDQECEEPAFEGGSTGTFMSSLGKKKAESEISYHSELDGLQVAQSVASYASFGSVISGMQFSEGFLPLSDEESEVTADGK
jgi:hypothetical protein